MKGVPRIVFVTLFPVGFVWRTRQSLSVLSSYVDFLRSVGGLRKFKARVGASAFSKRVANASSLRAQGWIGVASVGSIVACNIFWTAKIFRGVAKQIFGRKKSRNTSKTSNGTSDKPQS
eukprot:scaffold1781_cov416-Prasinococcus_capsulatus_cf.AAC.3